MKKLNRFETYRVNEGKEYKLPIATGDSEKDEDVFWFSTENKERSLVLDMFFEMIKMSIESGKKLKDKKANAQDFRCEYKPGDKNIYYNYEFWTEDEEVVKKSKNHYQGHEWQLICEMPYDIIEKLNSGDIKVEEARKRIESESEWKLRDGMDPKGLLISGKDSPGGWQLSYILHNKDTDRWLEDQKKKHEWKPQWLKNFSSWFTDKFA
jgi:hypothetical protein